MRSRNIKPGFFKNYQLGRLPYEVRLLFQGLWCVADRRGRLKDEPMQIKAEVFPYDPLDEHQTSTMLDLLQTGAFILRYEAKGNRYIQIINFEKHQYPHVREQDSTIPAPVKHRACTSLAPDKPGGNPDVLNPESGILNPESLNTAGSTLAGIFESIWKEYPKRLGKKLAFVHFKASVKTEVDVSAIRSALANYKKQIEGKDRQYIQHGSTWFNNWRDYAEANDGTHDSTSRIDLKALARAAREAQKARENATAGEIPASVRDTQDIQHASGRDTGGSDK